MVLNKLCLRGLVILLLGSMVPEAAAQSFDLRPQAKSSKKADDSVLTYLNNNDVSGMRAYLRKNKQAANTNSRVIETASGAKLPIPLFYDAVNSALTGEKGSAEMCQAIVDAGCDLHPVFEGKTPIYLLMDYFATHRIEHCATALKILKAFDSRSDWNANQRYRSELPPMNYLIRTNYDYLGQRFDKAYIADDVLKILIDHGASVTSYTDQGQTLMTFALDTGNQFLQDYFVAKGVNLTHKDDSGRDDLYRMIESGSLAPLEEAYRKGMVTIDVHMVKNDPREMARHKDLYDFVTRVCADQVKTYEDVSLFRSRYADKTALVADRYESMARQEVANASDYGSISACISRFPDLGHITGPKKRQIAEKESRSVRSFNDYDVFKQRYPEYADIIKDCRDNVAVGELGAARSIGEIKTFEQHYPELKDQVSKKREDLYARDCQMVQGIYSGAMQNLQNHRLDASSLSEVSSFVDSYEGYYDPDGVVPKAKALKKHLQCVDVAAKPFKPYYTPDNEFADRYRSDSNKIGDAILNAQSGAEYQLSSDWLKSRLEQKRTELTDHYNACVEALDKVNRISYRDVPRPSRTYESGRDITFYFGDVSFVVTNYSNDDYLHYVVHRMKGGRLSGFVKGYGSMEDAIAAGYGAAVYGFARTAGPPRSRGGILSTAISNQRMKLDIYNAKESDQLDGIIESWLQ